MDFNRVNRPMLLSIPEIDKTMIHGAWRRNLFKKNGNQHQMFRKEKMKEETLEELIVNNFGQEILS